MRRTSATTVPVALAALAFLGVASVARGQFGQTAMAPAGGIVNRAAQGLLDPTGELPGWFYYGINAADRGLGYNGSYMTLGGFIPYAEDDLGGLWSADLRGHLSVFGGFFSNVGAVRKQFLGGTILGVGVYWDYDGDLNQYPTGGAPGTEAFGQFGHVYNQVGVSGEWLTDLGNIRSNGYIPVGTTAHTLGAPGLPYAGNFLLCRPGLDAALGGADLEVGAWIPGLTDWAGMISVGGYAFGNASYDWLDHGGRVRDVVPWFGGVYTRLDMTFLRNWDFSLQANNDSYFDWTGFARLTYRMGGSRRRNVPDQMEQPMFRNEHIVRAHETPIVATNPATGTPWRVIHVDNTASFGGNGTAGAPVSTLAAANALATQPYDVVYVRAGDSAAVPYQADWQFAAPNQILVGEGSSLELATASCGFRPFFTGPSNLYPVLTSAGTAITLADGAIVDHFRIQNAPVGIAGGPALATRSDVNDVRIVGTNAPGQGGVVLTDVPGANVNLTNMVLENTSRGLWVDGGSPQVTFQGQILSTGSGAEAVLVQNTVGATVNVNTTSATLATPVAINRVLSPLPPIIQSTNATSTDVINVSLNTDAVVDIGRTRILTPSDRGVGIQGNQDSFVRITDLEVIEPQQQGVLVQSNVGSVVSLDTASIRKPGAAGLAVEANDTSLIAMFGLTIDAGAAEGVLVQANTDSELVFENLRVIDAAAQAFLAVGDDAMSEITILPTSSLSSRSDTLPAFESNGDAVLDVTLATLFSETPTPAPAISLQGGSTGGFRITSAFTVATPNPTPPPDFVPGAGTVPDNVFNTTGVIVTVP
jgi:hypothetical protein